MPNSPKWIVCESTGRWTAALRVALAGQGSAFGRGYIKELRSLPELIAATDEAPSALVLIEVRRNNLVAALDWFFQRWQRGARDFAVLGGDLTADQVSDVLVEAGALAVIDLPRRIGAGMEIAQRVAARSRATAKTQTSAESIAERAWAALPWQDA